MITDILRPALRRRFPERAMRAPDGVGIVAAFPAAYEEVGDVSSFDDGDEATVIIEQRPTIT